MARKTSILTDHVSTLGTKGLELTLFFFFMVNLSYLLKPSLAISKGIEAQSTGHNLMQVKKVSLRSHIVFWSMCRVMV